MKRHVLSVLAYVLATFAVQGVSHFLVAADHYAQLAYLRKDPILPFGLAAMLIQGTVLTLLYDRVRERRASLAQALGFSWTMGAFLVSYIALGEAGKYTVPSTVSWVAVEFSSAFLQFTLFGVLLGLIHRGSARAARSGA